SGSLPSCSLSAETAPVTEPSRRLTTARSDATIPVPAVAARNTRSVMARLLSTGLLVLIAAAGASAGIWPEQLGPGKRTSTGPVKLSDKKLWTEYGLQESEHAEYSIGTEQFAAN